MIVCVPAYLLFLYLYDRNTQKSLKCYKTEEIVLIIINIVLCKVTILQLGKKKHINFKCFLPKSVSKYLINQKIENEVKDFFHDFTEYLNFYIFQIFDLECSELWILMNFCSYQKHLRNLRNEFA